MEEDQQFCLRWNNHQSTIVSVFDNLLENETLIDCSLFAEGKSLKAHKVVLSACSPYFESVLTQTFDKHPIFVLKDVKFQELKAIMEYMYRGEVNISQDQLSALLKVAESLQIKGLSDSRNKENDTRKTAPPPPVKTPPSPAKTPPPAPTLPRVQGLTIEQRKAPKLAANTDVTEESRSRDGSISPVLRKRKKPKRRTSNSQDGLSNDNHDASSSSESHSVVAASTQNIPCSARSSLTSVSLASKSKITDVPDQLQDTKTEITTRQSNVTIPHISVSSDSSISQVPIRENLETHSELILEPKSEYIEEEMNEDSVEDLTLEDDDDVSQMEQDMDHARPGPSHGSTDNSQGFGGWHMSGNQAQDEVFLAAQEAVGAHRDSQDEEFFGQDVEQEIEYADDIIDQIPEEDPEPEPLPEKTKVMTTKVVRIIPVETIRTNEIIGEQLKKELSPHLTFDNAKLIKNVNKKIVDKEISLNKLSQPKNVVHLQQVTPGKSVYIKRKTLVASRMEKFLAMTASDCKDSKTKIPACLNPVLKTPVDTIRCTFCDELYVPTKKLEHLKVCRKTKQALPAYGCLLCSYKSTSQEQAALHVKTHHK